MELSDFYDEFDMFDSRFEEEYQKVFDYSVQLITALKELRAKFKDIGELPLYPMDNQFLHLIKMSAAIESEFYKFGPVGVREAGFHSFTDEEIREVLNDNDEMVWLGIDEWIDEGLLNPLDYKITNIEDYRK